MGILVSGKCLDSVTSCLTFSNRVALLRLRHENTVLNIIQAYAPTADSNNDEEIEKFYGDVQKVINSETQVKSSW